MSERIKKLREWGCDINGAFERFLNDQELYNECLLMFVDDDNIKELEKHINDENQQVPFILVHTLKGVSGNLGITPLYKSLVVLCESLRNNKYDKNSDEYNKVDKNLKKFLEIMK